jgi:hypothetical protein
MPTFTEIAAFRPKDIDEALETMRAALDYFHRENDHRAVFLRAYYLITIDVHQAVYGRGRYTHRVFMDPEWIKRLAGKFSSLYFQSLTTQSRPGERAWKIAHARAAARDMSVLQDMLLGLNAHINYDLAYGIFLNLREFNDGKDHLLLPRRKFDHDQVNNILVNCIPRVEEVLSRDYGGEAKALGEVVGAVDQVLAGAGLKYYRERVWWDAISFLAATGEPEQQLVREKLDWESAQLAASITCDGAFLRTSMSRLFQLFRKKEWGPITLEREMAARPASKPAQVVSPYV